LKKNFPKRESWPSVFVVDDDLRAQNRRIYVLSLVTAIMTKQFAAGPWSKAPRTFSSKPLGGAERLRTVDECSE